MEDYCYFVFQIQEETKEEYLGVGEPHTTNIISSNSCTLRLCPTHKEVNEPRDILQHVNILHYAKTLKLRWNNDDCQRQNIMNIL